MVRGFSIGSSWVTDPLLLKRFWYSNSGQVAILWFRGAGHKTLVLGTAGGQRWHMHDAVSVK